MARLTTQIHSLVGEVRRECGLTQRELALLAGVSRQTMVELEGGGYNPSTALALRLSVLLDRSVNELFGLLESEVKDLVARRDGANSEESPVPEEVLLEGGVREGG